jgi:hypothetical protein
VNHRKDTTVMRTLLVSIGSDDGHRNVGFSNEFFVHELLDAHVAEFAAVTGIGSDRFLALLVLD